MSSERLYPWIGAERPAEFSPYVVRDIRILRASDLGKDD